MFGPGLLKWSMTQLRQGIVGKREVFSDSAMFISFLNAKILDSILILCPVFAALLVGAVVACIVVSGFNFSPQALSLKFSAINPVTGFGKLFNVKSLVKLGVSIAKLVFVSIIVWFYLRDKIDTLASIRWCWSMQMMVAISKLIMGMMIRVCIALLVIAVIDVIFQKWKHISDLKMTKQEVKQERKDMEGSPEVKLRVRMIQLEMARKRMMKDVPKANVVLVNPTHIAVALRYDAKTMESPVVVAKGSDLLAEKIREIARAYGVPIIRRPELARAIYSTVETGSSIPQSLYAAVAEVLALIYRLRHRRA